MSFAAGHNPTNLDGGEWGEVAPSHNGQMSASGFIAVAGQRTGAYCFQVAPFGSASMIPFPVRFVTDGQIQGVLDFDFVPIRAYTRILAMTLTSTNERQFMVFMDGAPSSLTERFYLTIDTNRKLRLYQSGVGLLAGPSTAAISNTAAWTRVEAFLEPTAITVYIDGTQDLLATGSFSDIDSWAIGERTVTLGGFEGYVANFDDMICESSNSGTAVDLPGPGEIKRLIQDSDVVDGAWVDPGGGGSDLYQEIDEVPSDGDASYVRTDTIASAFRSGFETAVARGISGTIAAVKVQTSARNESTNPQLATRVRSSAAVDVDTGQQSLLTSYSPRQSVVHKTAPGTVNDWATADIDALEVGGILGNNLQFCRITAQVVQVDYNTGVVAGTFRARVNMNQIGGKHSLLNPATVGA